MNESIKNIKEKFVAATILELPILIGIYQLDERKGVHLICEKARRVLKNFADEKKRTEELNFYEKKYSRYQYICGIDEVGRGPLAGPVMAGAGILPKNEIIYYLNDSKKLSEAKREELYDVIMSKAVATGIGIVVPKKIDEINILQATYEAMREAIKNLKIQPDIILVDAIKIPGILIPQVPIIKGDEKSVSIAAASIIAKVTRDRLMIEYDKIFSEYGFKSNKGYGSKQHIDAIKKHGSCPLHRSTFIKNFL